MSLSTPPATELDLLRQQIQGLVAQYAALAHAPKTFVPGLSAIPVSGKVIAVNQTVSASDSLTGAAETLNGLIQFDGTILFASHDHQFVQTIANRIIEITPDGLNDYRMTYDEYLELAAPDKRTA